MTNVLPNLSITCQTYRSRFPILTMAKGCQLRALNVLDVKKFRFLINFS